MNSDSVPGTSKNIPSNPFSSTSFDASVPSTSKSGSNIKSSTSGSSKNVSFAPSSAAKQTDKNHELFLIVYKFLQKQMSENIELNSVQKESLEVVVQCLGYAFQFYEFDYVENDLQTLYQFFEKHKNDFTRKKYELDSDSEHEITPEDIVEADDYKEKGNKLMREEKFQEALELYDKAIRLNPEEPALYCNRAAAFNNLKKYSEAIEDCNTALTLNSSYAKAYIRKGFAHERLKNPKKALKCYKKAYQLEPENEHYKTMYTEASKRLKQKQEEPTSSYNTMFLGSNMPSFAMGQLPDIDNLMETIFNTVGRQ